MSESMRLIVMFDLPVGTPRQRKVATHFRAFLLKDGYYMLQFSCYCRPCSTYEMATTHEQRLENHLPKTGSVRSMLVTERQFARMKIHVGDRVPNEKKVGYEQLVFF